MDSTKTKKRTLRPKKARALLAIAAGLTLGSLAATGCSDEPTVITNDMQIRDMAQPVVTNPMPPDMAHD